MLQFGGASGSGYIDAEQYEQTHTELAKTGTFAKGVYTQTKDDGRKINKDANIIHTSGFETREISKVFADQHTFLLQKPFSIGELKEILERL